jgi:Protein of unknown function (DUF4232)
MARVRSRRVAELGMVAGCVAALVSACGTQHLGTSGTTSGLPRASAVPPARAEGKVPWVDRAAPVYTRAPAISAPKAPAAKYAACASADLTASDGDISMGAGSVADYIVLTNTGDKPCTLSGGPSSLIGIRADGSRKTLETGSRGRYGNLIGPANLKPGQSAQVAITTTYLCPAGEAGTTDEYTSVGIGIGGGDDQTKLSGHLHPLNGVCGAGVSDFGVPNTTSDVVSSPLDVLTASAAMPDSVTAGDTTTYQVTLRNPTDTAVPLSPCPSYAEFMAQAGARPVPAQYYLNCQAASEIPAGGSVTFDIQIATPAVTGPAKYGWSLQGTSVETGGVTTISGS